MTMSNTKKAFLGVFFLIIILVVIIGSSYAWLNINKEGKNTNVLKAGDLKLSLIECSEDILLEDAYPISDTAGENQAKNCKFSLQNEGSSDIDFSVYFIDNDIPDDETRMNDKYVKFNIKDVDTNRSRTELLSNKTNREITNGTIEANSTRVYELRVWMDYNADNAAMNTVFNSRIKIDGNQNTSVIKASTWFWANPNLDYEMQYVTNKEKRESVINHLQKVGINEIYINMFLTNGYDSFVNTYSDFIEYANSKNIKIFWLDGDPSSIMEENYKVTVDDKLEAIEKYNNSHKGKIEGMHYDVEFYAESNNDFGAGLWIDGQSEEAKKSKRRLYYINYARYAYQKAKAKGISVAFDVTQELSKFTYYDEDNIEKNMMEELLKYSDSLTVMYYVTQQKYLTTNNMLTKTGEFRFDNGETITVNKSTLSYINAAKKDYRIGSEVSSFRKDYSKSHDCSESYIKELVPTYIDLDFVNTENVWKYLNYYYNLELSEIAKYQKSNNMESNYQIAYHDVWEILNQTGFEETQVIKNRIATFNNETIANCK